MPADILAPTGAPVALAPPPSTGAPYVATGFAVMGGNPDEVVVAAEGGPGSGPQSGVMASGYSLDGTVLFRAALQPDVLFLNSQNLYLATIPTGGVAAVWQSQSYGSALYNPGPNVTSVIGSSGSFTTPVLVDVPLAIDRTTAVFSTPTGYHVEWVQMADGFHGNPADYHTWVLARDYLANGQAVGPATVLPSWQAYANITLAGQDFLIEDNLAQLGANPVVGVPGEPAASMTEATAVALTSGTTAAVAFADSGTAYVTIYNALTNSFSPRITVAWGGASDLHLVALQDGGFVVSWMNVIPPFGSPMNMPPLYAGEVFSGDGTAGPVIPLAGQVAAIDSQGLLYTVGHDLGGNEQLMTYAIYGGSSTVYTSDPTYTAPNGVNTIYLTGAFQSIHANNRGGVIWSDDSVNALYGGTGDDTFHLGRGGDWAVGGGGHNTFDFAAIPWQAGGILDFGASDTLDLTGLVDSTSDTGSDGFADGYLKLTDDGSGNAEVWANYNLPGADGWLPVTTLYGVAPSSLQHVGDVVSIGVSTGPTDVSTAAAHYTAPASVKTITLTGSHQVIDASATDGVTIASNDTGNALYGGPGDDVFHLGRGGDWAQGGGGADTFIYGGVPWAGGGITDFDGATGDKIDVTGLLANAGFTGSDPFTDGYLKYGSDSSGNAQLWADYNQPGNNGWWLVATLDGVSTASLHYANGLIT